LAQLFTGCVFVNHKKKKMNTGNGLSLALGKYQKRVDARLKLMQNKKFVQRLWDKDETLFGKDKNSANMPMGWLSLPDKMLEVLPSIDKFCEEIRKSGFDHAVLLGMGGSSLAPLVFQKTFGDSVKGMKLTVLDTTEPETIKKIENEINIPTTLFIVSSKSGTTAEVSAFYEYFYYRVSVSKREKAGENFIAITDEGSPLVQLATRKNFRKIFINFSDVGGRFSALSYFGLVPAALMGINVKEILLRAKAMAVSCGPLVPEHENTGVLLGTAIAEMAMKGCDKLTYIIPEELDSFGLWLEQLIAESTGKEGKGILPFNGLPLSATGSYGKDRFFVKIGFLGEQNDLQSLLPSDLIAIKYPFINILLKDELDLGKEFFRWEIATATAGAILGIDPFDQPNVQESKKFTDKLLRKVEEEGQLPKMEPSLTENSIIYYGPQKNENGKLLLEDLLKTAGTGDYITFQAYLPEEPGVQKLLDEMKKIIQKNLKLPVSVQFGPRYLHSTGQYHKGGPNTGHFIQFICSSAVDIDIPEHNYTFGMLKRAQAIGDREALMKHKRKVVLIDLGEDIESGLSSFKRVVEALQPSERNVQTAPCTKPKETLQKEFLKPEAVILLQNPSSGTAKKPGPLEE
jgi:transaldolase/glucose-6-phosphate isomerase